MNAPDPSKWRLILGPILLASLMVNLFLVGGVVGDRFAPEATAPAATVVTESMTPATPARPRPALATPMRDAIAQLPAEERRIVNDGFALRRQETRAARERMIAARTRAREVMAAETIDPTTLSGALAEMRAATGALQTVTHGVLMDVTPRLSADTRRKLADSLKAQ